MTQASRLTDEGYQAWVVGIYELSLSDERRESLAADPGEFMRHHFREELGLELQDVIVPVDRDQLRQHDVIVMHQESPKKCTVLVIPQ